MGFIKAIYAMLFFKPYTDMPRFLEILYGVLGWLQILIICMCIYNITD